LRLGRTAHRCRPYHCDAAEEPGRGRGSNGDAQCFSDGNGPFELTLVDAPGTRILVCHWQ
jgi:hypothetical protein